MTILSCPSIPTRSSLTVPMVYPVGPVPDGLGAGFCNGVALVLICAEDGLTKMKNPAAVAMRRMWRMVGRTYPAGCRTKHRRRCGDGDGVGVTRDFPYSYGGGVQARRCVKKRKSARKASLDSAESGVKARAAELIR